jgi:Arc/MetJ-type ribon-helix-helix transcriptional regulator
MSVKSSISLTDQQDAFTRSLVESGRYSSIVPYISRAWNWRDVHDLFMGI